MTKPKQFDASELIQPRFAGTPRQLELLLEMVTNGDPLKNNPAVKVDYYCQLIRPDEYAAADFAWQGLISKYGMSTKDVRLLFYIHRIALAYTLQGLRTAELEARGEVENN